jgi:anti-sigma regulatory factor (Ser/Thr protein kinase)
MALGPGAGHGVDAASATLPVDPPVGERGLGVNGDVGLAMGGGVLAVLRLPARAEAVGRARSMVRAAFTALGVARVDAEDGVLAVCELVTNALTHAVGPFELRVRAVADTVVCEVVDGDAAPVAFPDPPAGPLASSPASRESGGADLDAVIDALSLRGRGLEIVRRLCQDRCGCRPTPLVGAVDGVGKAMWFAMPMRPGPSGDAADAGERAG